MHINITDSSEQQVEENFFFEPIPNKLLDEKEYKEIMTKWYPSSYLGASCPPSKSDPSGSTNPSTKAKPNPSSRICSPIPTSASSTTKYPPHTIEDIVSCRCCFISRVLESEVHRIVDVNVRCVGKVGDRHKRHDPWNLRRLLLGDINLHKA